MINPKLNEILFSISCREVSSVVRHFYSEIGSGKSYLEELIGSAMGFHTEVIDADGFVNLANTQRILQSLANLDTPKRELLGKFFSCLSRLSNLISSTS